MFEEPTQREDPVDSDLEYTRGKRRQIIDKLTEKGVPESEETVSLLLTALNDMDRTSLGKKRIKVDSDMSANNKAAADLISSIFNMPDSKKFGLSGGVGTIPTVDGLLPQVELIEGEMRVGVSLLDYDTFMADQEKK
jgi:hypothetical protein